MAGHIGPGDAERIDYLIVVLLSERLIAAGQDGVSDAPVGPKRPSVFQAVAQVEGMATPTLIGVRGIGLKRRLYIDGKRFNQRSFRP